MRADTSCGAEARLAESPLGWLCAMLWPGAERVLVGNGPVRSDVRSWWVIPSLERPRLLVPTGPAAAPALRQFNDALSLTDRLQKTALGEAVRFGGGRLTGMHRIAVVPGEDGELIGSLLPRVFDVDRVTVAVSIGRSLRPNMKPVIQVMAPSGRVLGYAKIGWNEVSRSLLDTEANALARWAARPAGRVHVPEVLHHGALGALDVLALSPMPHPVLGRRRSGRLPASTVMAEVMALDEPERARLRNGGGFARLRERLSRLPDATGSIATGALDAVAEREAWIGRGHGDWAPWNMSTTRGAVHVWDWERSFGDVPLGLDPLHYAFEVAYHKRGARTPPALDDAVARATGMMLGLGLPADAEALRTVYVVERLLRLEEGRAAGVPVDERMRSDLLAILTRPGRRA